MANNAVRPSGPQTSGPDDKKSETHHVWTVLSSPEFAAKHKTPQESLAGSAVEASVTAELLSAVELSAGLPPQTLTRLKPPTKLQLWGAALPLNCWNEDCVWDSTHRIGIAGDWTSATPERAATIEAAWLSGVSLAEQIAQRSQQDRGIEMGQAGGRFQPVLSRFTPAGGTQSQPQWVAVPTNGKGTPNRARSPPRGRGRGRGKGRARGRARGQREGAKE